MPSTVAALAGSSLVAELLDERPVAWQVAAGRGLRGR